MVALRHGPRVDDPSTVGTRQRRPTRKHRCSADNEDSRRAKRVTTPWRRRHICHGIEVSADHKRTGDDRPWRSPAADNKRQRLGHPDRLRAAGAASSARARARAGGAAFRRSVLGHDARSVRCAGRKRRCAYLQPRRRCDGPADDRSSADPEARFRGRVHRTRRSSGRSPHLFETFGSPLREALPVVA